MLLRMSESPFFPAQTEMQMMLRRHILPEIWNTIPTQHVTTMGTAIIMVRVMSAAIMEKAMSAVIMEKTMSAAVTTTEKATAAAID